MMFRKAKIAMVVKELEHVKSRMLETGRKHDDPKMLEASINFGRIARYFEEWLRELNES